LLTALFFALQGLGPLLHAHVEGDAAGSGGGIHLHLAGLAPEAGDDRSATETSQADSAAIEVGKEIRRDTAHALLDVHRRPCIGRPPSTACLTVRPVRPSAPIPGALTFNWPPAHAPPLAVI
jgi:hypothetical protein